MSRRQNCRSRFLFLFSSLSQSLAGEQLKILIIEVKPSLYIDICRQTMAYLPWCLVVFLWPYLTKYRNIPLTHGDFAFQPLLMRETTFIEAEKGLARNNVKPCVQKGYEKSAGVRKFQNWYRELSDHVSYQKINGLSKYELLIVALRQLGSPLWRWALARFAAGRGNDLRINYQNDRTFDELSTLLSPPY